MIYCLPLSPACPTVPTVRQSVRQSDSVQSVSDSPIHMPKWDPLHHSNPKEWGNPHAKGSHMRICCVSIHRLCICHIWSVWSRRPALFHSFEDQDCTFSWSKLVWAKKKLRKKESGGALDHFVLFLKLEITDLPTLLCLHDLQLQATFRHFSHTSWGHQLTKEDQKHCVPMGKWERGGGRAIGDVQTHLTHWALRSVELCSVELCSVEQASRFCSVEPSVEHP